MFRKTFLLATAALAISLGGCVSFGILTQQQSEDAYTGAAIVADGTINSGKIPPDYIGDLCAGDATNYKILVATRNPLDGVKSYGPADTAHGQLQSDGAKVSSKCVPPPPTSG
jgi:hypothetical protein